MINILGINAYHGDASAALVVDGQLVAAVEAVLRGEPFVSSCLKNRQLGSEGSDRCREIVFFSDDGSLLDRFTHAIATALNSGHAAVVLATASHRDSLAQRLTPCPTGLDSLMGSAA